MPDQHAAHSGWPVTSTLAFEMNLSFRRNASFALVCVAILPLVVSLVWKAAIGPLDYISQGSLFLLSFVFPFLAPIHWKAVRILAIVWSCWFVWGFWRLLYFDPITNNDIPGIGYFVAPLIPCLISVSIFGIRKLRPRAL